MLSAESAVGQLSILISISYDTNQSIIASQCKTLVDGHLWQFPFVCNTKGNCPLARKGKRYILIFLPPNNAGKYPEESVLMQQRIINRVEQDPVYRWYRLNELCSCLLLSLKAKKLTPAV